MAASATLDHDLPDLLVEHPVVPLYFGIALFFKPCLFGIDHIEAAMPPIFRTLGVLGYPLELRTDGTFGFGVVLQPAVAAHSILYYCSQSRAAKPFLVVESPMKFLVGCSKRQTIMVQNSCN